MKRLVVMGILLIFVVLFLFGCGTGENQYVGKWVNTAAPDITMEIKRNGDAYILAYTSRSFFTGKLETKEHPAALKDGTLSVNLGVVMLPVTYNKNDDTLLLEGNKFKRLSK